VRRTKVPGERVLEALVKGTLLTFNDANVTGNYTRCSTPSEQAVPPAVHARETAGDLQGPLPRRTSTSTSSAPTKPVYDPAPKVGGDGRLLVGRDFPTEPVRVVST
jgi:hypothetical protein